MVAACRIVVCCQAAQTETIRTDPERHSPPLRQGPKADQGDVFELARQLEGAAIGFACLPDQPGAWEELSGNVDEPLVCRAKESTKMSDGTA